MITPYHYSPLLMLLEQPGPIRAYKLVSSQGDGIFRGGIRYEVGQEYSVDDANTDPNDDSGAGIHVATLDWCLRFWWRGDRILVVVLKVTRQFPREQIDRPVSIVQAMHQAIREAIEQTHLYVSLLEGCESRRRWFEFVEAVRERRMLEIGA